MPFANLFSNVAATLFGGPRAPGAGGADTELVRTAVEAIVDAVDPRLRTITRHQAKLAPAVERTIAHLRALGRDLPEPLVLARSAWGADPRINALFATAGDVPVVCGRCDELRTFFENSANAPAVESYALLGMRMVERNVLAPAIVDGQLRNDVAQTTVSFSGHRLIAAAADFPSCRREVGMRILKRLAALVLERITALGERANELEQRKAVLGAKLRLLNLRRDGLEQLAGGGDPNTEIAALERELKATVDDYFEAKASLSTLESRLEHIKDVFGEPQAYVNLTRFQLRVNKMGYKVAPGSSEAAADLNLTELSIGDGLKVIIELVRCPRAELPPRESLSMRAARGVL